jgi:uncharacterized membrane protein YkvI
MCTDRAAVEGLTPMLGILDRRFFRVYIIPGAVFQSIMVGGGYGTGREIVEYFTSFGAAGGLLAMAVAFTVLALVIATTFEYARHFGAYDYRNFFKRLIGRGWIAFEVLMILLFLLILAVLASASGNILRDNFGIPYFAGLSVMLAMIGVLTFYGRALIEKVLTFWSFFLYAVFIAFFVTVFSGENASLMTALGGAETRGGWLSSGFKYALYNLAVTPLLLYVVRGFETRGQALRSGVVAAAIAMAPATLFHLAFLTAWPDVLGENIPAYWLMTQLGSMALVAVFSVMLFGTFIETGAGMLQGINERIDGYLLERGSGGLSPGGRALIAVSAILVSAGLSFWGITNLIAQGYGMMAWGFLAVYVVPLMTIGAYRIWKQG